MTNNRVYEINSIISFIIIDRRKLIALDYQHKQYTGKHTHHKYLYDEFGSTGLTSKKVDGRESKKFVGAE